MASRAERIRLTTDQRHPLNGQLGVVPHLKSRKSFIKYTEPIDQHDGERCSHGFMARTTRAHGRQCAPEFISADEHLPAGVENSWTTGCGDM